MLVDVNGHDVAASTPEELSRVLALLAGAPGSPVTMIFRRYGVGTGGGVTTSTTAYTQARGGSMSGSGLCCCRHACNTPRVPAVTRLECML